jgi:hypothetical protein
MVISELDSVADRDYYSMKDPVLMAVGGGLPPFIAALQVLDIEVRYVSKKPESINATLP